MIFSNVSNIIIFKNKFTIVYFPGHHSALYSLPNDKNAEFNVNASVNYWITQGCPREKLIVGIPIYGRTYQLANLDNTGISAPSKGPGDKGPYTDEHGSLAYYEFCADESWKRFWVEEWKAPYAVNSKTNNWISYDDLESLEIKLNYILVNNLGGAMIWSIEQDDFSENSKINILINIFKIQIHRKLV